MSQPTILTVRDHTPKWGEGAFIAPNASLIGDVVMGDKCSVWFNALLRADVCSIRIGDECNIQDGVIVHGTYKKCGVNLGNRVSVGHGTILHGCDVGDGTLIGMDCTVMDKAQIGSRCLIGAGSLVTENTVIEEGHLAFGRPAKTVRRLSEEELAFLEKSADNYILYKSWYE